MKNTRNKKLRIVVFSTTLILLMLIGFAGCGENGEQTYIVSIEKTDSTGTETCYTITYSDGETSSLTIPNGENGEDGKDLTITDVWQTYLQETGSDLSLAEFIETYLTLSADYSVSVNESLLSCVSVYSESVETQIVGGNNFFPGGITSSQIVMSGGSGVIYDMDETYVYILTNYHVVYNAAADEEKNGGSRIGRGIYCYLYGSEASPVLEGYDEQGYYRYDYGDQAVRCEYIGGSMETDIAVLRAEKSAVFAVNDGVRPAEFADDFHVGETVYAIGNAEGNGLSVTYGVVSVDSEYISLDIDEDGEYDSYRSIRFDAAIYHGNSGGGLFNTEGKLIGITNAGIESYENVCYAIPSSIAEGAAENILYYYRDGDPDTEGMYDITLGITVSARGSKYALNEDGYGEITESVYIDSVTSGSLADQMGLCSEDKLIAVIVNDTEYQISRTFTIGDLILDMRPEDKLLFVYEREGTRSESEKRVLKSEDFSRAA